MHDELERLRQEIQAAERRLRTCMLVSVGSATFVLAGIMLGLASMVMLK